MAIPPLKQPKDPVDMGCVFDPDLGQSIRVHVHDDTAENRRLAARGKRFILHHNQIKGLLLGSVVLDEKLIISDVHRKQGIGVELTNFLKAVYQQYDHEFMIVSLTKEYAPTPSKESE